MQRPILCTKVVAITWETSESVQQREGWTLCQLAAPPRTMSTLFMHHNNIPWSQDRVSAQGYENGLYVLSIKLQLKEQDCRRNAPTKVSCSSSSLCLLSLADACLPPLLWFLLPFPFFLSFVFLSLVALLPGVHFILQSYTVSKQRFHQQRPTLVSNLCTRFSSSY